MKPRKVFSKIFYFLIPASLVLVFASIPLIVMDVLKLGVKYPISKMSCIIIAISVFTVTVVIENTSISLFTWKHRKVIRKVNDKFEFSSLEILNQNVIDRIKKVNPSVSKKSIYIKNDTSINAFAVGRKIVIHSGLLNFNPEQIEAVLSHEYGHVVYRDDLCLSIIRATPKAISRVNLIFVFTCFYEIVKILLQLIYKASEMKIDYSIHLIDENMQVLMFNTILIILLYAIYNLEIGIFQVLLKLMTPIQREMEYRCDEFASSLGYGKDLIYYLRILQNASRNDRNRIKDFFTKVHPSYQKRIENLLRFE